MLDLTIVGGGIQGTAIARALTVTKTILPDRLAILDPETEPLALWLRRTAACGMSFLRSPSSHNLDVDFHSLRRFGVRAGYDPADHYRPPYLRPSLRLFNDHSLRIAEGPALSGSLRRGRLLAITPRRDGGWTLETDNGVLHSRLVILAVGRTGGPLYPSWAADRTVEIGHRIEHVFSPGFRRGALEDEPGRIAVAGGGATGGQLVLALAERLPASTELIMISGGPLAVRQFDSEPCYLGPKCLRSFLQIPDPEERRRVIRSARYPGSIPPGIAAALRALISAGRVTLVPERVVGTRAGSGQTLLHLASGGKISADRVVLATGLYPGLPAPEIIEPLAAGLNLPRTIDGYPIPDATLQWAPGLFLTGPLGETEIGPGAPNIIGAQLAVRRILPFLRNEPAIAWSPVRVAVP